MITCVGGCAGWEPTRLRIQVRVVGNEAGGNGGAFKATYLMWWETGSEPRQPAPYCAASPPMPEPSIKQLDPGEADEGGQPSAWCLGRSNGPSFRKNRAEDGDARARRFG